MIVAVNMEVLFESLIRTLSLAITFGVIARGDMELHVKCLTKCLEEGGHELGAPIRCNVQGDSMLGEDMDHEEFS